LHPDGGALGLLSWYFSPPGSRGW